MFRLFTIRPVSSRLLFSAYGLTQMRKKMKKVSQTAERVKLESTLQRKGSTVQSRLVGIGTILGSFDLSNRFGLMLRDIQR